MRAETLQEIFEAIKGCDWTDAMVIARAATEYASEIGPPDCSTPEEREQQLFKLTYKAFG